MSAAARQGHKHGLKKKKNKLWRSLTWATTVIPVRLGDADESPAGFHTDRPPPPPHPHPFFCFSTISPSASLTRTKRRWSCARRTWRTATNGWLRSHTPGEPDAHAGLLRSTADDAIKWCLCVFPTFVRYSYRNLANEHESLMQKYLHLLQIVETEKTVAKQLRQQIEDGEIEIERLKSEVILAVRHSR